MRTAGELGVGGGGGGGGGEGGGRWGGGAEGGGAPRNISSSRPENRGWPASPQQVGLG